MHSIQHYVIKIVSDLRQVCGFFPSTPISSTIKTDRHNITKILLKVALNTINQPSIINVISFVGTFRESNRFYKIRSLPVT